MAKRYVGLQLTNPCHLLASGFGTGLSPIMPGSVGSLAALLCWWLLANCSWPYYTALLWVAAAVGVYICGYTARDLALADPKFIVWDEFVGLWTALIALPSHQWQWIMAGFMLFRLFDICKPWPIGWIDRHVHGGLGIMLDDIVAGGMTACLLWLCSRYGCWVVPY